MKKNKITHEYKSFTCSIIKIIYLYCAVVHNVNASDDCNQIYEGILDISEIFFHFPDRSKVWGS